MALFDDDDDVLPQLKGVNQYACKDREYEFVCFSVLPFWFDEEHELASSEKGVYIYGTDSEGLQSVCEHIKAWRVELDCEMPKISVLSSENNWIRLLNPHLGYAEDIARSVLITIQMIHFVRRHPAEDERTLSKHLSEVFRKFVTKPPEVDDLQNSYPLIKYCMEMDPSLMESKILRRPIEDTWTIFESELRKASPKQSFIVSNELSTNCNDYTEDGSSDDNGDSDTDGNASDNDTEAVCAICDEGGTLLGCKGECKRSFHPRQKDGKKSFCKTLGYTSHEVKEIPTFICSNCQYKQHQCFKCGKLDSSDEKNPKVFQCCNASCGHFYHPKCVAELLEPGDDGAFKLEKLIAAGMTFTCPVHWCFECKQMEDRSQTQLRLAVCRRCVRSYHNKCLPREISFEKKDVTTRAWKVPKGDPKIIFIYCLDHDIDATIRTPCRDHIKFPSAPQIERVKDLARKKVKVTDVRNANEVSPESAELSTKPSREEDDQSQEVPISISNNLMEHNLLEHECATTNLRVNLQYESPIVGAAAATLISSEAVKSQEKQMGTSILMEKTAKSSPCPVNSGAEMRLVSIAGKGGSLRTCEDIVIQSASHAPFLRQTKTKTQEIDKDQCNVSQKPTHISSRAGTCVASCQTRMNSKEDNNRRYKGDIPEIGSEKVTTLKVGRKRKRNCELEFLDDKVATTKYLMNEFLARSFEIYFELASQLEELKQEQESFVSTQAPSLKMGMAFERVEKVPSLIVEKENRMATESNDFKQMEPHRELSSLHKNLKDPQIELVECESTLKPIQSKIHEVKRLRTKVIDFVEIEESSSFHCKATAEALITKVQSDMTLVWGKLSQCLVGLGEEAMLDPEVHSFVQKCYFVADQANELIPCLPEAST